MLIYCHICNTAAGGLSFNAEKMEPKASLNVDGQELN